MIKYSLRLMGLGAERQIPRPRYDLHRRWNFAHALVIYARVLGFAVLVLAILVFSSQLDWPRDLTGIVILVS